MTIRARLRMIFAAALAIVAIALYPPLAVAAPGADDVAGEHIRVELVSEHESLMPGQSEQVGILLHHAPHWHTYWTNPGDSGLATKVEWVLPPGYKAQDIVWLLPRRFDVGSLYNFGYDGDVLLPVALDVPANAVAGSPVHITAVVKWLACKEACVPGKASLPLDLPVTTDPPRPDARWTSAFALSRLAQPQATAWKASASTTGDRIVVTLNGPGLPDTDGLDAFVAQHAIVDNKPPAFRRDGDALIIDFGKSDSFVAAPASFDLVLARPTGPGVRGWKVQVPLAPAP
jgi:thiol:disulfide interchange protein DsbD